MFYIKRIFGVNHDWLHAWDDQWGTSCMGSKSKAMVFATREEADTACERANATCIGFNGQPKPDGMHFVVCYENPSTDQLKQDLLDAGFYLGELPDGQFVIADPLDDDEGFSLVHPDRAAMIQEAHQHLFTE